MRGFTARNMGLVDRRPVVCRNLAMGFWVPLHSSKLPTNTVQDAKALATELAAGLKDGDEEKAIRAESAHVSPLEVCTVEPVKCNSTARLNRLNHGFTIFSFLKSLDQAQQRRLAVEVTRKQLQQRFRWAANTPI